jgi:hypothetical protein
MVVQTSTLLSKSFLSYSILFLRIGGNVSICVRAGLPKPCPVPDTERNKDTKTLDYTSTPLDANTLLWAGPAHLSILLNSAAFFLKYSISSFGVIPSISFEICSLRCLINSTASNVFFVFVSVFITLKFLVAFLFLKFYVRS